MSEKFNKIEPFRTPTNGVLVEIEPDSPLHNHSGDLWLDYGWLTLPEARALRDWLNRAIPEATESADATWERNGSTPSLFDRYPVRTLFQKTESGAIVAMLLNGETVVAQKSNEKPSASTDDTPPGPTSSVECPKCRTQLAFEGDECWSCKEDES